jgi:hypothetical protein
VRCGEFSDGNLHSRMPLVPTPLLLRLMKLVHTRGHWHSSRVCTPLTGWHSKLRPNTEGNGHTDCNANPNSNPYPNHHFCPNTEGTKCIGVLAASPQTLRIVFNSLEVRCSFFTMDSAVLGLGSLGCGCCTVWRVFGPDFALEDAIGIHAFAPPLEALACV